MSSTAVMVFRVLAGMATISMVSSPSLLMYRIHKQKHVGVASVSPLAALLANSHVWMMYGYIESMWFPVFACFLYGECCAVTFLCVYTYYCSDKNYVVRTLAVFLTVLAIITIYAIVGGLGYTGQSTKSVGTIIGILADCAGICLYGAPMEKLFQVLKHKSAVFINVHMVIAGLVNNSIWLVYGVLITNWFIIFINVLFVSANTFTLCLYEFTTRGHIHCKMVGTHTTSIRAKSPSASNSHLIWTLRNHSRVCLVQNTPTWRRRSSNYSELTTHQS